MVTATGIAPGSEMTAQMEQVEERNVSGVLHVAAIFASHMVLQRNKPIAVFGALAADCAGMEVVAEIHDFDGSLIAQEHAYSSQNVVNGFSQWRVMLPAQPEGGPYTLRIVAGNDAIEFDDVLIGEVWLAGGQSNMELELRNSEHADEALEDCADPLLRFYNVPKTGVINRNAENTSSWQESSPENSGVMSAVAYYFARKLRSELDPDLPVGIVDCYIGGTSISCWMSEDALNSSDAGRDYLTRYQRAIAGKTQQQFELETSEWQLPQWINGKTAADGNDPMRWPVLREAQWDAAQSIDNVYAICTIDCGEYDNIHPLDTRTPGERLANCALRQIYGMDRVPVHGPTVLGFRCDPNGRVRLFFRYAHGLHFEGTTPGGGDDDFDGQLPTLVRVPERSGFELAGSDGMFHPATAAIFVDCDIDDLVNSRVNVVDYNATEFGIPINSRSIGTITLATPDVPEPVAMRYAWRSWGPAPLFNDDGLPAQPFRLDLTDHTSSVESAEPVTPDGTAD